METLNQSTSELRHRAGELTYEEYAPPENLFAVVSWGAAATHWLSRVLNDCPGIYCAHANNTLWTQFADAQKLDGVSYLKLIGMLGSGAKAAGDVHEVSRYDIAEIRKEFGDRFRAAILVRHPLRRLGSQLGLFEKFSSFRRWDVGYLADKFPNVELLLPTGSYDEWLFVHAANMLNAIVDESLVAPIFRMEDVTGHSGSLRELIRFLTASKVRPSWAWSHWAIATGATNRHATSVYRFLQWQRSVLDAVVDPRAVEAYVALGYELVTDPHDWLSTAVE